MPAYSDAQKLADAREEFFAAGGFSLADYEAAWVHIRVGPLPLVFPNTSARKKAVRLHDLHHILTGYPTDWPGEVQISAWELGAGCGRFWAAWLLNLAGAAIGLLRWPRATVRAWRRGRRCRSLYTAQPDDALLDKTVGELRDQLGLR